MAMRCPNNHPTLWCQETADLHCNKCSSIGAGFLCKECEYMVCTQCSNWSCKEKVCPNKHTKLIWVANINYCINKCPSSDGFRCINSNCQYSICRKCISDKPKPEICFNGHEALWKTNINPCLKCSDESNGWECEECEYCFCSKCTSTVI
jgi:hypothetical protein